MSNSKDNAKPIQCVECGKKMSTRIYPGGLCSGCYNYYIHGGTENEIPPIGVIAYDCRGYVICHICGRAYRRLGSHVRESHNTTIAKYKKRFGLCARSKVQSTTSKEYHDNMSKKSKNDENIDRLSRAGRKTRIQQGDKLRKGKQISVQEKLALCKRMEEVRNNNG